MSKGGGSGGGGGGAGQVKSTGGVDYVRSDRAVQNGDVVVEVDVAKLDQAWKNDSMYIDNNGKNRDGKVDQPGKIDAAKKALADGKKIHMPEISYNPKTGAISVSDGRHRIAAIRGTGKKTILVTTSRKHAKALARKFGVT